jgi:inositol-phosphate phosphatase/L-galactose 1-phosphate phosphatase/histidinol-phosphatase
MDAAGPDAFVALAGRLADAAGEVIRPYFRTAFAVDEKADASPVTVADRESEAAMRAILAAECPDHGILGEEYGAERTDADYVWVLDPIDGTKSFIAGVPLFGTLIALLHRGRPIVGIIDQPVLGERWLGVDGQATHFNGAPAKVRSCAALATATLTSTSPDLFDGGDAEAFVRLHDAAKSTRYGYDCYGYAMLAMGFVDLAVEAGLAPYDYCALVPVIAGAGGVITDWAGAPLGLGSDGRICAAGDARVHAEALDLLNP